MKKLMLLVAVMFLMAGCSQKDSEKGINNNGVNIYMNTDSNCAGIKRVDKDYDVTDPKEMLERADYCFFGTLSKLNGTEIYDDGKIKTSLTINVKDQIKGELSGSVIVYRDGGSISINDYLDYPGETCFDKNKLEAFPDTLKSQSYLEVVPATYFKAEENNDYLFFVQKNGETLEIYNDAYGMLKVKDKENIQNIYTNKEFKISELSGGQE